MRFLFALFAMAVIAAPAAQAGERITVNEVHHFVAETNTALNHPDTRAGSSFLQRKVASNARFENNVMTNVTGHPYAMDVWYSVYGYYRYPYSYYPYHTKTSFRSMDKWDMIGHFENKKRLIVGYRPELSITGIKMRPNATSAVVDVDMKEYSLRYSPYMPELTNGILHATSKCKMYLGKHEDKVYLTRMDCNTNSNLPF